MPLSLKAKLNIIAREPAPARPRDEGLIEYAHDEPLSGAISALDGCPLTRLGVDGHLNLDRAVFLDTETTAWAARVQWFFWWD